MLLDQGIGKLGANQCSYFVGGKHPPPPPPSNSNVNTTRVRCLNYQKPTKA